MMYSVRIFYEYREKVDVFRENVWSIKGKCLV